MSDGTERDLTPYDLAQRIVDGLPVTDRAEWEVAQELVYLRVLVESHSAHGFPPQATVRIILDRIRGPG